MNMIPKRLDALRVAMAMQGLDAYLIPTADPHGSEYVNPHHQARAYLSGFTGSAGSLLVTGSDARLWTDCRYFLQAEKELKGSGILLMKEGEEGVPALGEHIQMCIRDSGMPLSALPLLRNSSRCDIIHCVVLALFPMEAGFCQEERRQGFLKAAKGFPDRARRACAGSFRDATLRGKRAPAGVARRQAQPKRRPALQDYPGQNGISAAHMQPCPYARRR